MGTDDGAGGAGGTLTGAREIYYRRGGYALGRTDDRYAIWPLSGGEPVRTFPLTNEGWSEAWPAYEGMAGESGFVPTSRWERGTPIPLREMRVGQLLDAAFKLYRMYWRTLIPLVAFVVVPFGAVVLVLTLATLRPVALFEGFPGSPPGGPPEFADATMLQPAPWVNWGATFVQWTVITPFLTAAVVRTAADAYLGARPSVGSAYRAALPRVHSILWVTILVVAVVVALLVPGVGIAVAGEATGQSPLVVVGVLLAVAGGLFAIFLAIRFAYGASVVMIEDQRGRSALRRSSRLVKNLWWKVLGTLLLVALLQAVVGLIVGLPALIPVLTDPLNLTATDYALSSGAQILTQVVTTPFVTLVIVLLYFDARIRKEGFDLEVMAQQVGAARPPRA